MARRLKSPTATLMGRPQGRRVGSKSRDMRWLDPTGAEWDSKFEWQVYEAIRQSGQTAIRRTTSGKPGESDTFAYDTSVRDAKCRACGSSEVGKRRTYTPDLHSPTTNRPADSVRGHTGFYIEVKGYLRAEQRSLLRAFCKERPDVDIRFVLQRDFKVGAGTAVSWITKYLKRPVHIWNGRLPNEWLVSS